MKEIMNVRSYCAEYYLLSDTKTTRYLKWVLPKSVLIDLRARENLFACTLRARSSLCAQFVQLWKMPLYKWRTLSMAS